MKVDDIKSVAAEACQEYGVRRLDAFGSLARDTSGPSSDVDLLVEFEEPDRDPAKRFFGLLHHLEDELGCKVDLLTPDGLRNPYVRERVLHDRVTVYEG